MQNRKLIYHGLIESYLLSLTISTSRNNAYIIQSTLNTAILIMQILCFGKFFFMYLFLILTKTKLFPEIIYQKTVHIEKVHLHEYLRICHLPSITSIPTMILLFVSFVLLFLMTYFASSCSPIVNYFIILQFLTLHFLFHLLLYFVLLLRYLSFYCDKLLFVCHSSKLLFL